jgi:hypothetical protein
MSHAESRAFLLYFNIFIHHILVYTKGMVNICTIYTQSYLQWMTYIM